LAALIVAARHLGLAKSSRSFAKQMGVSHAFVLRECQNLAEEFGILRVTQRNEKTLRIHYELTEEWQVKNFEKAAHSKNRAG
jgi:DNA-binding transcriptional MocR family regulator